MPSDSARLTINGRQWRIRLVKSSALPKGWLGSCDHPPGRKPTIDVKGCLEDAEMAEVVAHEVLHAAVPTLDEEAVTAAGAAIGRALSLLGYRRTP